MNSQKNSKIVALRTSAAEHDAWRAAATGAKSFNAWARATLNEAAAGELAKTRDADFAKGERLAVLEKVAPVKRASRVGKCIHGQDRATQFCSVCDRVAA
jgi:hypothetical protein